MERYTFNKLWFIKNNIAHNNKNNNLSFLLDFLKLSLFELSFLCLRTSRHDSTTPVFSDLISAFVEVCGNSLHKVVQRILVFGVGINEGKARSGLLVDNLSETGFSFYNAVRNLEFAAESRQKENDLKWINIVGDNNQRRLLVLDKLGHSADSRADNRGTLGDLLVLSGSAIFSASGDTLLLGLLGFWTVLVKQTEKLSSGLLIQSLVELMDGWGNLQTLLKHSLLALKADVLRPTDEARQIAFGLDILADSIIAWAALEERVLLILLRFGLLDVSGRSRDLLLNYLLGRHDHRSSGRTDSKQLV